MAAIDMSEMDTQTKPMKEIDQTLSDLHGGFINGREALGIINAIVCEWKY